MRRHIRPRCADTSHWGGVPETRLTRVEANLQTDSPQVNSKTTHMPRAGSGLANGEKTLLLPAPRARHSEWQRAPRSHSPRST